MRLGVMIEGQEGPTYEDLLAVARRSEDLGLEGLFRSDHYTSGTLPGERGATDAWATLAGLARETSTLHLGTLVSPATFRTVGNLAKVAATVSAMAGAGPDGGPRISLGLGTGWMETEHRQHGFPFEDLDTRFRRLEEYLQIVRGLWDPTAAPFSFSGEFAEIQEARSLPFPIPRPRIVVGGQGLRRTPRLAARYADELNAVVASPGKCQEQRAALVAACEREQRDPATVSFTLMTGCVVGSTQEEFLSRARRLLAGMGSSEPVQQWVAARRDAWILGTIEQARDMVGRLAEAGVSTVRPQLLLVDDLEMLDLLAGEVFA